MNSHNREDKIILIADYGRSGQGWLSYMLCYILNARYIEPYCLLRGLIFSGEDNISKLVQGNLDSREKTKYSLVVKTHECPDPYFSLTDKVILLARDPRDVAVSGLARFQVLKQTGTDVEINAQKERKTQKTFKTRKSFVRRFKQMLWSSKFGCYILTARNWSRFYNTWQNIDLCHKVTYEDLSFNTKQTLIDILKYLEVEVSEELIEEAIQKFTFKSITGREKGAEQKNNVAFRKGIVGDYKNNFNKCELLIFDLICGKIMRKWGYY